MKRFLSVIVLVFVFLSLFACGAKTEMSSSNGSGVEGGSEEVATYVIKTPYCDLKYAEKWQDKVNTEVVKEEPYTLSFSAKDGTKLFDLIFNGNEGTPLGTITGDEYTAIHINDNVDIKEGEYLAMREDINVILQHLMADYDFAPGEILEKEDNTVFAIKTKIGDLYYPNKWKEKVTIDVSDEKVSFSCKGIMLFDLVFAECEGYLLGTYDSTPIYIVDGTDAEEDEMMAMHEDVNVILQYLMEDPKFVINM